MTTDGSRINVFTPQVRCTRVIEVDQVNVTGSDRLLNTVTRRLWSQAAAYLTPPREPLTI